MSFTKLVIIGALAVALLPSDKHGQQKLIERASNAANWAWTFCDRNEQTCHSAERHWATFKDKAAFGATLAQDAVWQALTSSEANEEATASKSMDTLTVTDRTPNWRGRL
ncbi:MAG: hypothetical protein ACRBCJ_05005 [Hyphomicrobiaceae bacterium]